MLLRRVCVRRACASAASCDFSELISVVTSSVSSGEGHYVFSSLAAVCVRACRAVCAAAAVRNAAGRSLKLLNMSIFIGSGV